MRIKKQQDDGGGSMDFLKLIAGMNQALGDSTPTPMEMSRMELGQSELQLRREAQDLDKAFKAYQMDPNNPDNVYRMRMAEQAQKLLPLEMDKMTIENQANRLGNVSNLSNPLISESLYPSKDLLPAVSQEQRMRLLDQLFKLSGFEGNSPSNVLRQNAMHTQQMFDNANK